MVAYQVVQGADGAALDISADFEGSHLRPRVLVEERPVLRYGNAEASDEFGLRRRLAEFLHQLVPGALDLVRPEARSPREGVRLPQLVEDGPPDFGDGVGFDLGPAPRIEDLDGAEKPDQAG